MKLNRRQNKFLGLVGMGLFVALAPVACGGDDGGTSDGTAGKASGGKGGSSSSGGKAGSKATGGKAGSSSDGGTNAAGDETGGTAGAGGSPATTALVRIVHASPSAPSVDIYAAGSAIPAASDVEYGEATGFVEVDAGIIAFDLRATGADAADEPAFTTADIELTAGAEYTLVAAGDFAELTDEDTGFRVLALEHDFEAVADSAVARVVHATTAWAEVDLDVPATVGVDVEALPRFGDASNVALTAATALDVSFSNVTSMLSKLTLPARADGEELFVIATGNPGFPFRAPLNGFALLVVDQDGNVDWVKEQPWVHMVHASDIGPVDVYEATETAVADRLLNGLTLANMGAFQLKPSIAGYNLKAVNDGATSGTSTALATGATSTLALGEHYLSVMSAGAGSIQTVHEQFGLGSTTQALFRGVHASAGVAATVDFGNAVGAVVGPVIINAVAPGEASALAGTTVAPGDMTLGVAADGTTINLITAKAFTGVNAPVAAERDFVLFVQNGALGTLWLVNTSVAGWTLR